VGGIGKGTSCDGNGWEKGDVPTNGAEEERGYDVARSFDLERGGETEQEPAKFARLGANGGGLLSEGGEIKREGLEREEEKREEVLFRNIKEKRKFPKNP